MAVWKTLARHSTALLHCSGKPSGNRCISPFLCEQWTMMNYKICGVSPLTPFSLCVKCERERFCHPSVFNVSTSGSLVQTIDWRRRRWRTSTRSSNICPPDKQGSRCFTSPANNPRTGDSNRAAEEEEKSPLLSLLSLLCVLDWTKWRRIYAMQVADRVRVHLPTQAKIRR